MNSKTLETYKHTTKFSVIEYSILPGLRFPWNMFSVFKAFIASPEETVLTKIRSKVLQHNIAVH